MSTSAKKSKGRQKIEMKRIPHESNLQVCFSKRRSGLFKKACELCTLCGVEIAIIVFSPGNKVFSFGHPSVEAIIQRYLSQAPNQTSSIAFYIEAQRSANVRALNMRLSLTNNQLDADKEHGEQLNRLLKAEQARFWWACPIQKMDRPHLEQFRAVLNELKKQVNHHCAVAAAAAAYPPDHHFFAASNGPANTMIPFNHPPPPPPQVFPQQFFQGPMPQAQNFYGYNNMGGYGGGPSGF